MKLILLAGAALVLACQPADRESAGTDTAAGAMADDTTRAIADAGQGATAAAVNIDACVKAVLAERAGRIEKLEYKDERGTPTFEFDVRAEDGALWDIECSQAAGKVTEVEQDVTRVGRKQFTQKAKISEADARKTALEAHDGKVKTVDYEIQQDGTPAYEFDIVMSDGKEMKVEVNAASGEILEANLELWQIGPEEPAKT